MQLDFKWLACQTSMSLTKVPTAFANQNILWPWKNFILLEYLNLFLLLCPDFQASHKPPSPPNSNKCNAPFAATRQELRPLLMLLISFQVSMLYQAHSSHLLPLPSPWLPKLVLVTVDFDISVLNSQQVAFSTRKVITKHYERTSYTNLFWSWKRLPIGFIFLTARSSFLQVEILLYSSKSLTFSAKSYISVLITSIVKLYPIATLPSHYLKCCYYLSFILFGSFFSILLLVSWPSKRGHCRCWLDIIQVLGLQQPSSSSIQF